MTEQDVKIEILDYITELGFANELLHRVDILLALNDEVFRADLR